MSLKTVSHLYKIAALLTLTLFLFFLGFNLLAWTAWKIRDRMGRQPEPIIVQLYGWEKLQGSYGDMPKTELRQLLMETWSRSFSFKPYVQFQEAPYSGRFIHVNDAGIRATDTQALWPPQKNDSTIFVFGGSTTFGYGIPDLQTVPAQLQDLLRAAGSDAVTYNFGSGYYYSTQERILFEQLLIQGHRPRLAIFIDGLNDFVRVDDTPQFNHDVQTAFDKANGNYSLRQAFFDFFKLTPAGKTIHLLTKQRFLRLNTSSSPPAAQSQSGTPNETETARKILDRIQANHRLIQNAAALYGVQVLFVWQPVPVFAYRNSPTQWDPTSYAKLHLVGIGYQMLQTLHEQKSLGPNALWCADIFKSGDEDFYVDQVHYSARGAKKLAACIAEYWISSEASKG